MWTHIFSVSVFVYARACTNAHSHTHTHTPCIPCQWNAKHLEFFKAFKTVFIKAGVREGFQLGDSNIFFSCCFQPNKSIVSTPLAG